MHKRKNGMELGLNTIVMAVIALAVLIVVIIIFSGRMGLFGSELNNCVETGKGKCVSDSNECSTYNGRVLDFKCSVKDKTSNQVCCVNQCTLGGGTCDKDSCDAEKELSLDCGAGKTCCRK